jgi:hypothetical protein
MELGLWLLLHIVVFPELRTVPGMQELLNVINKCSLYEFRIGLHREARYSLESWEEYKSKGTDKGMGLMYSKPHVHKR